MSKLEQTLLAVYGLNYAKTLSPKLGITAHEVKMEVINPFTMQGYNIARLASLLGMYRSYFEKQYCDETTK